MQSQGYDYYISTLYYIPYAFVCVCVRSGCCEELSKVSLCESGLEEEMQRLWGVHSRSSLPQLWHSQPQQNTGVLQVQRHHRRWRWVKLAEGACIKLMMHLLQPQYGFGETRRVKQRAQANVHWCLAKEGEQWRQIPNPHTERVMHSSLVAHMNITDIAPVALLSTCSTYVRVVCMFVQREWGTGREHQKTVYLQSIPSLPTSPLLPFGMPLSRACSLRYVTMYYMCSKLKLYKSKGLSRTVSNRQWLCEIYKLIMTVLL